MPIDLEELERLAAQATPGPWVANNWGRVWYTPNPDSKRLVCDTMRNTVRNPKSWRANARFIAAMREALPELIAENRALREKVRALEGRIQEFTQLYPCTTIDFPQLRASVAGTDNSLSDFLNEAIKRAAHRP